MATKAKSAALKHESTPTTLLCNYQAGATH